MMGGLKTYPRRVGVALVVSLSIGFASQSAALPRSAQERVQVFAECTGRMSALMEHQWLTDGPASEETARERAMFADLLEAVLPGSGVPGRAVWRWRIEAKAAQAALLQRALFAGDARIAGQAGRLAQGYVAHCREMVLGTS